ncbi:hypothetical protein ACET3Z_008970 [Daucus carota]
MALPYEMIDEILCRLPVKPLLRFQCVSKEWCGLTDSNAFAKKQLRNTLDCNANAGLGLMIVVKRKGDRRFYLAGSDSLDDDESAAVAEIDGPLKSVLYNAHIVGSSNGLMCVFKNVMDVFVLNPTTRKYRKIARVPPEFRSGPIMKKLCGFGYDEVDDDFKVVMFTEPHFFRGLISVYSLKTNTWAEVQDVPDDFSFTCLNKSRALFLNGSLYWMAQKALDHQCNSKVIIVGFDLKLRHFREVPLPPIEGAHPGFSNSNLVDIGGCLCFLDILDSHMDLWLMNYPGANSIWHKAFSVKKQEMPTHTSFSKLVAFSGNREDILLQVRGFHTQLAWYNIDRKTVKNIGIQGIPLQYCSFLYTESLLQLTEDEALQQTIKRQEKEECIKMERVQNSTREMRDK